MPEFPRRSQHHQLTNPRNNQDKSQQIHQHIGEKISHRPQQNTQNNASDTVKRSQSPGTLILIPHRDQKGDNPGNTKYGTDNFYRVI